MFSQSKTYLAPTIAFFALWGLCLLVTATGGLPEPLGTLLGQGLSHAGHTLFMAFGLGWIVFSPLAPGESRRLRIGVLVATLVAYAIMEVGFKQFVYLPRPGQPLVYTPGRRASGFPSGHTVPAFAIACLLASISPRLTVPALGMAVLIGYSRVEVTAHYAYQVVLSAGLGILVGSGMSAFRTRSLINSLSEEVAHTSAS